MASQSGTTPSGNLTSTGFTRTGKTPTYYLDDDGGTSTDAAGTGKVWTYYISGTNKVYDAAAVGTINYITGEVFLPKMDIATVGQVDGVDSTVIRLTIIPASYDVVPVRNQILEIDATNLSVIGAEDTIAAGSSDAGVNYTTTASY